jgi:hypothetical protein
VLAPLPVFRRAVFLLGKIFDRHNVQWIERGDFAIPVQSRERTRTKQNKFRMRDRILAPVWSAQAKGPETSGESSSYAVDSHGLKLRRRKMDVNVAWNL